jgi:hypothetical protein
MLYARPEAALEMHIGAPGSARIRFRFIAGVLCRYCVNLRCRVHRVPSRKTTARSAAHTPSTPRGWDALLERFAQKFLGHSTVERTARVYTHLDEQSMRVEINRMDAGTPVAVRARVMTA